MTPVAVGVDVGGTFTDLIAVSETGEVTAFKLPSTPHDQSEAVAAALALLQRQEVVRFVHGTTVATNMLLERTGARVALVTTEGFTDILHLARQDRASLYDLTRHREAPLVPRELTVGAAERVVPEGTRVPLDDQAVDDVVENVRRLAPQIVAIALLHSYHDDRHERRLADAIARACPALDVVRSSEIFPEIREYERMATTVAEAYLRPGVARYLARLSDRARELGVPAPGVMTSGGGMRAIDEAAQSAAALALSGPAGGVVGAAAVARDAGIRNALTVDIGGTSADVGLILGGEALVESGGRIAGVPIALPRVLVETVSAGGGSIGWIDDGGALRVGPHSAGAVPGPAAFARGGSRPTVTDAHVVLGHITATTLSGGVTLDASAARAAIGVLADELRVSSERVARAMVDIADAAVARAMRRVSVERGVDSRECVLIPFGGGGPLHCCGLADQLGMRRIYVPPHAGMLSALGLAITAEHRERMVSVLTLSAALDRTSLRDLLMRAASGVATNSGWNMAWVARARYVGQGFELDVPVLEGDDGGSLETRFGELHEARNGFVLDLPVEIIGIRYMTSGQARTIQLSRIDDDAVASRHESENVRGEAIRTLSGATLRIAAGWRGRLHPGGGWMLEREEAA